MTQPDHSMRPSDEADARQLDLARQEGAAYQASLQYMTTQVADSGASQRAGEYIVGYAQEKAEGMYMPRGEGQLEWMEPAEGENCHLEISVSDAADGRFVPYLTVHATLTKDSGERVGPFEVPFVWHPGLHHYGTNIQVPGDGSYDLYVRIEPPPFMRHDQENGHRYARTVEVDFGGIPLKTGRE